MSAPVFEGNLRAATGSALSARGWHQEAALRMLHNNLDPAVAERAATIVAKIALNRSNAWLVMSNMAVLSVALWGVAWVDIRSYIAFYNV